MRRRRRASDRKASIVHGQGNLFGDAAEMNAARLIKTMGVEYAKQMLMEMQQGPECWPVRRALERQLAESVTCSPDRDDGGLAAHGYHPDDDGSRSDGVGSGR